MVDAAERDGELIAHLAAECARLHEAEVVGIGGLAGAHQAGLLSDKPKVLLVAIASRFGKLEHAIVDAGAPAATVSSAPAIGVTGAGPSDASAIADAVIVDSFRSKASSTSLASLAVRRFLLASAA